jgi:hypothetical protein
VSYLYSIAKGVKYSCKNTIHNVLNSNQKSDQFITREEFNLLKTMILDLKSDIEQIKKDRDHGKNS